MLATLCRPKPWPRRFVILSQPALGTRGEGSQLIRRPAHGFAEGMTSIREIRFGQQGGGKRKTLRAKVLGGSLGNSTSSLAVFYVEQVALNRHVSPQPQLALLCLNSRGKSIGNWEPVRAQHAAPQFGHQTQFSDPQGQLQPSFRC